MKYGLLSLKGSIDAGAALETAILRRLYAERGVSEVERVPLGGAADYRGERMRLPVNARIMYSGPRDARLFATSPDVETAYLGLGLAGDLRSFARDVRIETGLPVGCLDVGTRDFLRRAGANAYFSGCASMTLPRRADGDYRLVYVVDEDPRKGLPFCDPVDLRPLSSACLPGDADWETCERTAMERVELLRDTAKAVVTSNTGVYVPCVALGIPVVLTHPRGPRATVADVFCPATADVLRDLVRRNIVNALFDEGECVARELDDVAVVAAQEGGA